LGEDATGTAAVVVPKNRRSEDKTRGVRMAPNAPRAKDKRVDDERSVDNRPIVSTKAQRGDRSHAFTVTQTAVVRCKCNRTRHYIGRSLITSL